MMEPEMLRLQPATLDWVLEHALHRGDTDIFPPAFEFRAIQHDWNRIRSFLTDQNVLEWRTRPTRTCLSPKGFNGFGIATQLDPLGFLVFCGLVHEIAPELVR